MRPWYDVSTEFEFCVAALACVCAVIWLVVS